MHVAALPGRGAVALKLDDGGDRGRMPALAAGLGRWWYLILAAAVIGPLMCLVWPGADRITRMLGFTALFSLAAYLVTPETAAGPAGDPVGFAFNLRYLAPALTLCLAIAPIASPLAATTKTRTATAAAIAIILAGTIIQPRLWSSPHAAGAVAIGLVAALGLTAALGLAAFARKTRRPAIFAGAAVALAIAAYPLQAHYLRGRYAYHPNVS